MVTVRSLLPLWHKLVMPSDLLPDPYAALGNFTINALPEGRVVPKGNNEYDICIDKMYYFINDTFNFEGSELLGWWKLNKKYQELPDESAYRWLCNSDLGNFTRHGYGREFPVLSSLHEVENFKPVCKPYIKPRKYKKPGEYEWRN